MAPSLTDQGSVEARVCTSPVQGINHNDEGPLMWSEANEPLSVIHPLNITTTSDYDSAGSAPISPLACSTPPVVDAAGGCEACDRPERPVSEGNHSLGSNDTQQLSEDMSQLHIDTDQAPQPPPDFFRHCLFYNSSSEIVFVPIAGTPNMIAVPPSNGIYAMPSPTDVPLAGPYPPPPPPQAWIPAPLGYSFSSPETSPPYHQPAPGFFMQSPGLTTTPPPLQMNTSGIIQGVPKDHVIDAPACLPMPHPCSTPVRSEVSASPEPYANPQFWSRVPTVLLAEAPCGAINENSLGYPESVSTQMEIVWHGEFEKNFYSFFDEWKLQAVEKPPDKEDSKHFNFFKDSAKVRFMCQKCNNAWTSMKGRVMFWFALDREDRFGAVLFKLYGQACLKCYPETEQQNADDVEFCDAMWYPEEVVKVIGNIFNRVGQVYYNFKQPNLNMNRRLGNPRLKHDSSRCQACKDGVCRFEWVFSSRVEDQETSSVRDS